MMRHHLDNVGKPRPRLRAGPGRTPVIGHSRAASGIAGRCLPRRHGKAGNQVAMIMAECHKGMARQTG
jgi:hypothetical protein